MNVIDWNILHTIYKYGYTTQRKLTEQSGYSLGKINKSIKVLMEQGYLNDELEISEKAIRFIKQNRPRNAVILAAGYGIRMVPINSETPKAMLEINGEPLIERLIKQLQQASVNDITIVVGFKKESFEYLIDKYNVKLVVNMEYHEMNNLHSLQKTAGQIGNTYILPCDIWCAENPFSETELYSWYMVNDQIAEESNVRVNRNLELVLTRTGTDGNGMVGIAYLLDKDAKTVIDLLDKYSQDSRYDNAFWEETLYHAGKMIVNAKVIDKNKVYEINTFEQLRELDGQSKNLKVQIMSVIAQALNIDENEITNINVMKKGMTNRSFIFESRGIRYIMRIPGEGTEQLINREEEYEVYQTVKQLKLSDKVCYFDPETGYKLTEYLEDNRNCNANNWDDISKCMKTLKEFHHKKLSVKHTFDLYERIEFYESLWRVKQSCYKDYVETKEHIYELKQFIESANKEWTLCHIDSVADNFMINNKTGEVHLIDWEYAGMQDPDIDIAMFSIYSLYNKEQIDRLIDIYYENDCEKERRLKIYCYVAICGFIWSNWCEYKSQLGVEFGEYSLRQYRYAKDYYQIFMKEMENR